LDPLPVHPESQGAQAATFLDILSDPSSVSIQRPGKVFNEGSKEALPRLVGSSLENAPQRSPFIEPAQGKRYVVWMGH
jgi:hypothetical protein